MTMQRDMKIGMALGVALVGIVGALFFRREPEVKDKETPPPLQNAEELDREIAGKAKAPYIKGLEEYDSAAAPVPAPSGPANKADDTKPRDATGRKPAPAPEPIQPAKTDALANDQVPAHNRDWEPTGPSGSTGAGKKAGENQKSSPAGTNVGTNRTHVIQPGDTLSALASRYLGSSARYKEIYEANRNVLRSPNDVREGLSIVIPDSNPSGGNSPAGKPREAQHVAEGSGSAESPTGHSGTKAMKASARTMRPDVGKSDAGRSDRDEPAVEPTNDRPRDKIRFVPVPRGPFSAGRVAAPGTSMKSDSRKAAAPIDDSSESE
jgi:LysM repeat protein